jgi:hypothetical protein
MGVQSAVALHLYKGGGLDPLRSNFRVNPTVLGNKSREKLGTLTVSAHARTVRAATADSPDRRPSGLRARPSVRLFLAFNSEGRIDREKGFVVIWEYSVGDLVFIAIDQRRRSGSPRRVGEA